MPTLYILVGYPGAGKTTTAGILEQLTGATHVWVDRERRKQFSRPTHSEEESQQLYQRLNAEVENMLASGFSVIFDTSFNYARDRQHMREICTRQSADLVIIYIDTPLEVAADRALRIGHTENNQHLDTMTPEDFARVAGNLEQPAPDENPIILDGTKISTDYVRQQLGISQ